MMQVVLISEFMDEAAVAQLRTQFEVDYDPALVDQPEALEARLATADAWIVRNRTQVTAARVAAAPRLRVVGRLGVGLDNIDVAACAHHGVEVIPATGANAQAVAEYVVTAALVLLRGAYAASAECAEGGWPRNRLSGGRECAGKVLGLVGFGGIGQLTARLARGLGMDVVATDPALPVEAPVWAAAGVRTGSLDDVVAQADVVSLHVPLLDSTRGLFDAGMLARMKPGAVLINTARGGIVDEQAVVDALRAGHLGGAALDVFNDEPLPAAALPDLPNLILTPHIAGVTVESNERVSGLIAERVAASLRSVTARQEA